MTRTKFEKVTKKKKKKEKRIMQNPQISRKNQLEVLIFLHKFALNHTWLLVNTHFSQKKRKKQTNYMHFFMF